MSESWLTFDNCCSNCGSKLRIPQRVAQRDLDLAVLEARLAVVNDIEGMLDSGGWEFVNKQDFEDYKADLQKKKDDLSKT